MIFSTLPATTRVFVDWPWSKMQPYYQELEERPLSASNTAEWLGDWSHLRKLVDESYARLQLGNARNTTDEEAARCYHTFLEQVYPSIQSADQKLKEKLLASGLKPEGFEMPLRNMQAEADLFREANLPLMTEEHKLGSAYNKIVGAQTVLKISPEEEAADFASLGLMLADRLEKRVLAGRKPEPEKPVKRKGKADYAHNDLQVWRDVLDDVYKSRKKEELNVLKLMQGEEEEGEEET